MTNQNKYNLFVLLSMFGRSLIETFPTLILYSYGINIKMIIIYFLFRYLSAIPINYIFIKIIKKYNSKVMLIISSITIGITYYHLYNMQPTTINILLLSLLTTIYVYSYWSVRNYYMLQVINKEKVTSGIGNITIINTIAIMPSVYIGAFILQKFNLLTLITLVFIINLISIIPLIFIKLEPIKYKQEKINISTSRKIIMCLSQFKTVILSIFPLYIYLYINNEYTYLGVFNFLIGLASILIVYVFSKIINIKNKSYLRNTIFLLSCCFFIKLLIKDQYIFLSIAILEGLFIKMEELSFNSCVYKLGKDFDYINYILYTENLFNISRLIIVILLLFVNDIRIMLIISIFGYLIGSFFKFDIESKK